MPTKLTHTGFTLVEMVTVILILGVLAVGVSSFVIFGTRIFVESTSIDQVLSQSRFAIERMTRELRSAVPNSVRLQTDGVSSQCIEFVPISASASYLTMPIAPAAFAQTGTAFTPSQPITAGQHLVIYPLTAADVYTDPEVTQGRLLSIDSISVAGNGIRVDFGRPVRCEEASATQRFFVVNEPVSYCVFRGGSTDGQLVRYTDYGINRPSQPLPATMFSQGHAALMAEHVVNDLTADAPFKLSPSNLRNNAIVQLRPEFEVNGQRFQYQHQVQVVNVP